MPDSLCGVAAPALGTAHSFRFSEVKMYNGTPLPADGHCKDKQALLATHTATWTGFPDTDAAPKPGWYRPFDT